MDGYTNPVIPGFHPDPSVCRVGDEYFLATSSFTYFPGVPILRSSNLVDWTQVGNALDRPALLDLNDTEAYPSLGVFAPTLRHHDGRFWMITTVYRLGATDNYFVTARDPAGPWSEPVRVDVRGIDPDLAWDEAGRCWVHFSSGQRILRCRIDTESGAVLEGPDPTWSGSGLQFPEAPHLFERDGTWYLVIAEGGTERGHAVSIARGPAPTGPWEPCPANPILSHRSTDLPIQNTGHADLVEATDGSWWMVLLATRPRGASPRYHVMGRETFLAPVQWVDGWPCVDQIAVTVEKRPPGTIAVTSSSICDDFDASALDPRWIAVRHPPTSVASLSEKDGWLTLFGGDATLDSPAPVFVGRRQQHERCRAAALVDLGDADEAGLSIRMDERSHYDIAVVVDRVLVRARIGPAASEIASVQRPAGESVLFIETRDGSVLGPPDIVVLGYVDDGGERQVLAELDGRYLSTEVAGGMLGRVIGMYAVGGSAAFDWFDYVAVED
jgi:xylan 1,4-beta-xylosidase